MSESFENRLQAAATLGKRAWIQEYLQEHLPALDTDRSPQVWEAWNARLRQHMAEEREPPLSEPKQQKPVFSLVNKAVMRFCGLEANDPLMRCIGLSQAEHIAINQAGKQRLLARKQKPLTVTAIAAIVAKADALLDSEDWAEIVCGLAVTTGRRLAEVMLTAELEPCKVWSVRFSGQLKTGGTLYDEQFEIPTLVPAARVLAAIAKLRQLKPLSPPSEFATTDKIAEWVNGNHVKAVKDACNQHFEGLLPPREEHSDDLYSRLFRVIYATIAHYWFGHRDVHKFNFMAYIQGHRDRSVDVALTPAEEASVPLDLASARSYDDYYPALADGTPDGRVGLRLAEDGVEPIDWLASALQLQERETELARAAQAARDRKQSRPRKRASLSADQFDRLMLICSTLGCRDDLNTPEAIEQVLLVAEAALEPAADLGGAPFDPRVAEDLAAKTLTLQQIGIDLGLESVSDRVLPPLDDLVDGVAELLREAASGSEAISALERERSTLLQQNQLLQAQLDEAISNLERLRSLPGESVTESVSGNDLARQVSALAQRIDALSRSQEEQRQDFARQLELALSQQQEQFQLRQQQAMALLMGAPLPAPDGGEAPISAPIRSEPAVASKPEATSPQPSQPASPSPPRKLSDSYLDTKELVTAIFKFNEEAAEGDLWFVASKLVGDLLKVRIKDRDRALNDLKGAIDDHHAAFDLNHTANRTNNLKDLVEWLRQHFPDLRLRGEFYD